MGGTSAVMNVRSQRPSTYEAHVALSPQKKMMPRDRAFATARRARLIVCRDSGRACATERGEGGSVNRAGPRLRSIRGCAAVAPRKEPAEAPPFRTQDPRGAA